MPIKKVPENNKEVTLRRWRVMEVEAPDGTRTRHVWGHDVENNLGRSSTAIVHFDTEAMTATTRSGRNYRLHGLPGNSRLGRHAWSSWCETNGVVSELDITDEYLSIDRLATGRFNKINRAALRENDK